MDRPIPAPCLVLVRDDPCLNEGSSLGGTRKSPSRLASQAENGTAATAELRAVWSANRYGCIMDNRPEDGECYELGICTKAPVRVEFRRIIDALPQLIWT